MKKLSEWSCELIPVIKVGVINEGEKAAVIIPPESPESVKTPPILGRTCFY